MRYFWSAFLFIVACGSSSTSTPPVDAQALDGPATPAPDGPTTPAPDGTTSPAPDAVVSDLGLTLPVGCPPAAGNELGIGAPCTAGGGECTAHGLFCTCDSIAGITPPAGTPCMCTNITVGPCPATPSCGTGASCCTVQIQSITINGCVPSVCLTGPSCPFLSVPTT